MLESAAKPQTAGPPTSHPRRLPAHLSVSLRHEGPSPHATAADTRAAKAPIGGAVPGRQLSDGSNESGRSSGNNLQNCFDRSNKHLEANFSQGFEDYEPPYFLAQRDSNSSDNTHDDRGRNALSDIGDHGVLQTATGSSADEFRSVIDDLTIENRKLREKLRKHENANNTTLDKDKLFEIKIHALPARKKRELEDLLREFASSMDDSPDDESRKKGSLPSSSLDPKQVAPKHASSSGTSASRLVDSAYATMTNSGSTSTFNLNLPREQKLVHQQQRVGKEQKIQTFLHKIPEGLLPKHSTVMTEKQKKKIVVRRLEQLFIGKQGVLVGEHSLPFQQQEVSRFTAEADRIADGDCMTAEGIRRAHILSHIMEIDLKPKISEDSSRENQILTDSSSEESPYRSTPGQRPNKPLDLDPGHAQIPSDIVDYLRHLSLSTPQLASDDSRDSLVFSTDADGWIYLNLLVNIAQLHIINVTADFVRAAVEEVSEKFQLSRDGKKVRWRGGTKETNLSGDSGAASSQNLSPHDNDGPEDVRRKRRNVGGGTLEAAPVQSRNAGEVSNLFHYTPLFHHNSSSSGVLASSDESDSYFGYETRNDSGTRIHSKTKSGLTRSHLGSHGAKRRNGGPIVFYSGAKFCTDLSGDHENIETPRYATTVGKNSYSNCSQDALGCEPRKHSQLFSRTNSGSLLPFRPFRDPSGPKHLQTDEMLDAPDAGLHDGVYFPADQSVDSIVPSTPLQDFNATGLGGTYPADHFAFQVKTRRVRTAPTSETKISRFSARRPGSKNFVHIISNSSLEAFRQQELQGTAESITNRLASLNTFSSPFPQHTTMTVDLPIKTEILSTQVLRLEPSKLPPPIGYYGAASSSDADTSSSSESRPWRNRSLYTKSATSRSGHHGQFAYRPNIFANDGSSEKENENEYEEMDEDGSESIDMLTQAREQNQDLVATQEQEFAREVDQHSAPVRSTVATVDDESGYESVENDEEEEESDE